jgi:hypothetical protein
LQSFGTSLPAGTRSRFIGSGQVVEGAGHDYTGHGAGAAGCVIATRME